jgi:hypothetical protein
MRIRIQPELQCWTREDLNVNPDPDVSKPNQDYTTYNCKKCSKFLISLQ